MKTGADTTTMFDDLKSGLSAPIAGMSVSFTSSLFGLAGSLILGFLDLQAGQAQNRFYTEFEEFLADAMSQTNPPIGRRARDRGRWRGPRPSAAAWRRWRASPKASRRWCSHMRHEQQQIRDWANAQAAQQDDIRKLLRRLVSEREPR